MSDNILEIFATSYMWLLEHMFLINVVFSFLIIFFQRKNPTTVWAWLLLLYFSSDSGVSPVHDPGTEFQEGTHVQNERD